MYPSLEKLKMDWKVLITTSGTGSRLGDITKYTNKSLVRVGKKPAISYAVEAYPEDTEYVITIGYFGEQVKEFLTLAYPNRKFTFVDVDNYEGAGSSLGYSMLCAKEHLQCPFIFHACDTIVLDKINLKSHTNWVGEFENNLSNKIFYSKNNYRTICAENEFDDVKSIYLKEIYDKGWMDDRSTIYIGLAGIFDYDIFWDSLESIYNENKLNSQLSDCDAINKMLDKERFEIVSFNTWLDIGNLDQLNAVREVIPDKFHILDKVDESIFIFDDFVIKFFYDKTILNNRVLRGNNLKGVVPNIIDSKTNFYKYEYVNGDLVSDIVDNKIFYNLLDWAQNNLWIKKEKPVDFYKKCNDFYFVKTKKRIDKFLKENNIIDKEECINGKIIPTTLELINNIGEDFFCDEKNAYRIHGDFILDNMIYTTNNEFCLIDWRQDFGGDLECGDIYYDIAKLNHNLIINHDIVNKNLFSININDKEIKCDIMRNHKLCECQEILHYFVTGSLGLNWNKVQIMSSIIWLNMAPLHHNPFNIFLYYFGKYNLYKHLY